MRLHGYCTQCRRIKYVSVSGHGMAMLAASGIPQGVCQDCEEKERERRTGRPGGSARQ